LHLGGLVARSPHAVSRLGRAVRPTGAVTAVRTRPFWPRWINPARPLADSQFTAVAAHPVVAALQLRPSWVTAPCVMCGRHRQ